MVRGQQHRCCGGRRGVRRGKAQPARRSHVDRDRRVMWTFTSDHTLDHDRGGMSNERARACGQPGPCAARGCSRAPNAATRPSRGCARRNARAHARRSAHRVGRPAPTARPPARLPRRAGGLSPRTGSAIGGDSHPRVASLLVARQHRLPLLLARQHRQCVAIDPAHRLNLRARCSLAPGRLTKQRKHFRAITLPVNHTAAVGGGDRDAVDLAQREPAGILRRDVDLRAAMVLGVVRSELVHDTAGKADRDRQRVGRDRSPSCATACPTAAAVR